MNTPTPELDTLDNTELHRLLGQAEALKARILYRLAPQPAAAPAPAAEPLGLWNMTAKQVRERTGMSRSWLYRNVGKLPFASKVGTRWRFSGQKLERYLQQRSAA